MTDDATDDTQSNPTTENDTDAASDATSDTDDTSDAISDTDATSDAISDTDATDTASDPGGADHPTLDPDRLASIAAPLARTAGDPSGEDLSALDPHLADATVVGLGEVTHGTRECFELRRRLLRRLVTDHGLRAVALEANLTETRAIDDYVAGDPDADRETALAATRFWIWQVEEMAALLDDLRAFNEGRDRGDRVRVYGVDAQYTGGAAASLGEQFAAVDPEFLASIREDLDALDEGDRGPHEDERRAARIAAAERLLPRVREHLHERRADHVAATSRRAHDRALRDATVIEQVTDYRRLWVDRDGGGDLVPEAVERCLRLRDRAMADNAEWVVERSSGPVAVCAHDAHCNRREQRSRSVDAAATSLGGHLADRYGDGYWALGFAFGRGRFRAVAPDGEGCALRPVSVDSPEKRGVSGSREREGSRPVDAALDRVAAVLPAEDEGRESLAPFVLDCRAPAEGSDLAAALAVPRPRLSAGATFDPDAPGTYRTEYAVGEAFDAVCYLPETTATRPLSD